MTAARSTAPVTARVAARPASRACSTDQQTSGRPRNGARSLWPPDGATYLVPPPAHKTTAPVFIAPGALRVGPSLWRSGPGRRSTSISTSDGQGHGRGTGDVFGANGYA